MLNKLSKFIDLVGLYAAVLLAWVVLSLLWLLMSLAAVEYVNYPWAAIIMAGLFYGVSKIGHNITNSIMALKNYKYEPGKDSI